MKGSKERYLLGQKHNLQIVGILSFIKLQNVTCIHTRAHTHRGLILTSCEHPLIDDWILMSREHPLASVWMLTLTTLPCL